MKLRKVSAVLMSMSMVGAMAVPTFADEAKTIEPCEITFWHAMNGKQEESLTALTDKFNEENEYGITVTLVNQGNYSDLSTKLTANAAADTLPDLSQGYNNWVTAYTDKIVPLDDFVTDEDFDSTATRMSAKYMALLHVYHSTRVLTFTSTIRLCLMRLALMYRPHGMS